jgi:hypothetical protein
VGRWVYYRRPFRLLGAEKPFFRPDEAVVKQSPITTNSFRSTVVRVRSMIEAVIAILGLFSAGLFVVHAVDAYRAQ